MMTKEERLDKARDLHERGYNCAQSVTCAFADKTEVPVDVLFAANEEYGASQGTMVGVCGALMGTIMLGGLWSSTRNPAQPNSKPATMKLSRGLMKAFEASAGALYCKDLKGVGTGKVICTCPDFAVDADGTEYNIEVQRKDNGADPRRARFHASLLDTMNVE